MFPRIQLKNQSIFVSEDYTKLIEFYDNNAYVYALEKYDENGIEMKTCFDFKVKRLPLSISDNDPYQQFCLFSPNFDKHFDI